MTRHRRSSLTPLDVPLSYIPTATRSDVSRQLAWPATSHGKLARANISHCTIPWRRPHESSHSGRRFWYPVTPIDGQSSKTDGSIRQPSHDAAHHTTAQEARVR